MWVTRDLFLGNGLVTGKYGENRGFPKGKLCQHEGCGLGRRKHGKMWNFESMFPSLHSHCPLSSAVAPDILHHAQVDIDCWIREGIDGGIAETSWVRHGKNSNFSWTQAKKKRELVSDSWKVEWGECKGVMGLSCSYSGAYLQRDRQDHNESKNVHINHRHFCNHSYYAFPDNSSKCGARD